MADAKVKKRPTDAERKKLEKWFTDGGVGATEKLEIGAGEVAIRMYGQGIGDCFLIAFPNEKDAGRPYYVLIDCGLIVGTPDAKDRMAKVVYGVRQATGGTIDLLVITHQHWDHISAFDTAYDLWKEEFTIQTVWMAWTEDDNATGDTRTTQNLLRQVRQKGEAAVRKLANNAARLGLTELLPELMSRAAFLGTDATGETDGEDTEGGNPSSDSSDEDAASTDAIMLDIQKLAKGPEGTVFCSPGDVRPVGKTGVRAFILGPPIDYARLSDKDPHKDGYAWPGDGDPEDLVRPTANAPAPLTREQRERGAAALALDANGLTEQTALMAAAMSALGATDPKTQELCEAAFPFAKRYRIPWPAALAQGEDDRTHADLLSPFATYVNPVSEWRRVDYDWLGVAESFAVAADGLTNNTSLVIAFELPGDTPRPILLFVGDAQAGNWLSWWDIKAWKGIGLSEPPPTGTPDMNDLLARTCFYKVGHHGSHNASLKGLGVEKMGTAVDTLTAFIPVSYPTAHNVKRWCEMPFDPLCRALVQRTNGRVFTARGRLSLGKSLAPESPVTFSQLRLAAKIRAKDIQQAKLTDKDNPKPRIMEPEVPLWIQIRLDSKTGKPRQ